MSRDEIKVIADIVGGDKTYSHFVKRINKEFDDSDEKRNSEVYVFFQEEADKQIGFCVVGSSPTKMKVWEKVFKEEGWVNPNFEMTRAFELMYMYIAPEYRRQGLGSKLFQKAHDFTNEQKVNEIYAYVSDQNPGAVSFYQKMNAKIIQDFSDEETTAAFLQWKL